MNRRTGFRPGGYDPETEYQPEPVGTGSVGYLSDQDPDEEEKSAWSFSRHVYLSIQIGPFALVLGRPDE